MHKAGKFTSKQLKTDFYLDWSRNTIARIRLKYVFQVWKRSSYWDDWMRPIRMIDTTVLECIEVSLSNSICVLCSSHWPWTCAMLSRSMVLELGSTSRPSVLMLNSYFLVSFSHFSPFYFYFSPETAQKVPITACRYKTRQYSCQWIKISVEIMWFWLWNQCQGRRNYTLSCISLLPCPRNYYGLPLRLWYWSVERCSVDFWGRNFFHPENSTKIMILNCSLACYRKNNAARTY